MFKCNKNSHFVLITHKPLDPIEGIRFVTSPKCGAINTFVGIIRDMDIKLKDGKKVGEELEPIVAIFYEAYESMAKRQIETIIETIVNNNLILDQDNDKTNSHVVEDSNCKVYVAIRLGRINVSEASSVICVSSTGRYISHKATMSILEKIKSEVTIWKKILYKDGSSSWCNEAKSEAYWLK